MFSYLKKKLIGDNFHRIHTSFEKVSLDIIHLQEWITHLHRQAGHLQAKHDNHVEITQKDLAKASRWIHYLHQHLIELRGETTSLTTCIHTLEERLGKLEKDNKGQVRTLQGTSEYITRDKSRTTQSIKRSLEPTAIHPPDELSGAQLELLHILFHSDHPLSYEEIAKRLNKREKSIRNLIHDLKSSNIIIRRKPIGLRKMGYYLPPQAKVELTGR